MESDQSLTLSNYNALVTRNNYIKSHREYDQTKMTTVQSDNCNEQITPQQGRNDDDLKLITS